MAKAKIKSQKAAPDARNDHSKRENDMKDPFEKSWEERKLETPFIADLALFAEPFVKVWHSLIKKRKKTKHEP